MTFMTTSYSPNDALYRARSRLRLATLTAACLLLTACATVGPDYQEPLVDSGEGWSLPLANASGQANLSKWWSDLVK